MKCSAETMNRSSRISPSTILSVSGACVTGFEFQHIIDMDRRVELHLAGQGAADLQVRDDAGALRDQVGRQMTSNL